MAHHILRTGHTLFVYARRAEKVKDLQLAGARSGMPTKTSAPWLISSGPPSALILLKPEGISRDQNRLRQLLVPLLPLASCSQMMLNRAYRTAGKVRNGLTKLVRERGFEPLRVAPLDPKSILKVIPSKQK